ncbi:MAG: GNAT family N-acetyltransferase [Acidobacteriaceae bacterium]
MPPATLSIRRATASDLPALQSLLDLYYREGDVQVTEDDDSLRTYLNSDPNGFFVAEQSSAEQPSTNEIAGCVLFRRLTSIPQAAECKRLFVLPRFRGHNIAAQLMDTLEATARASNLRWLYLDSKDNFPTAIAMYRRRGYTDTSRYNQNPEATIFLRKDLGT